MNIKIATHEEKIKQLRTWINDLQTGMYVNCVYCGHRYGPAFCSECNGTWTALRIVAPVVAVAMADVLKQHVVQCPEHPMAKMRIALETIQKLCTDAPNQPYAYTVTKISQQADWALTSLT